MNRDNSQLEKMRQLGMTQEDEHKLSMMRDYIAKLASSRQASVSIPPSPPFETDVRFCRTRSPTGEPEATSPDLQDLGIVPQTIFFGIRSLEDSSPRQTGPTRFDSLPRRFSSDSRSVSSHDHGRQLSGVQLSEDLRKRLALGAGGGTSISSIDAEGPTPASSRFISTYGESSCVPSGNNADPRSLIGRGKRFEHQAIDRASLSRHLPSALYRTRSSNPNRHPTTQSPSNVPPTSRTNAGSTRRNSHRSSRRTYRLHHFDPSSARSTLLRHRFRRRNGENLGYDSIREERHLSFETDFLAGWEDHGGLCVGAFTLCGERVG